MHFLSRFVLPLGIWGFPSVLFVYGAITSWFGVLWLAAFSAMYVYIQKAFGGADRWIAKIRRDAAKKKA